MPSAPPPTPPAPPDDRELADHGRFLRGLAGSLVADPALADDAVQEAWLAGLRTPPDASRPLRPWLARVVINAVRKLRRGQSRAAARERAVARPEAQGSVPDLRERERLLRQVLDAVLTLPEAQREAVLLRYYEALPPRAIAGRLGVPVTHVYASLSRAVGALRARLDAAHGGRRGAWSFPLAAALGVPSAWLAPVAGSAAAAGAASATPSLAGASVPLPSALTSVASSALSGALAMSTASTTFAAVIVSLGAGLGAGWYFKGQASRGDADRVERAAESPTTDLVAGAAPRAPSASPALEGQDPARRIADLERATAALAEEKAALASQVQDLKALVKSLAPEPLDPKAMRFGLGATSPAFDKANWADLSGHVIEMTKLMPRFRAKLQEGGSLPPDMMQDLQEHNTPLAIFAVTAAADLKGTGPNGAYTHPAVIANLMRAALLQANDPLSKEQEAEIVARGYAWASDEERRLKSLPPDALALAATVGEVDGKQRFLDAAKRVLTDSQRGVLFQPETEGRLMLDLLSPALVYMTGIAPAEELDAAKLPAKALETLLASTGAQGVESEPLLAIAATWIDEIPGGRDGHPPGDPELRFPTVERVQNWARAQANAMQRILDSGRLNAEQAARVRKYTGVIAPYVVRVP